MSEGNIEQDLIKSQDLQQKRTRLGKNSILRIFVFQTIGTCILTFGVLCSRYIPPLADKIRNPFHEISVSFSLYLAIVLTAPFSGGHYNSAVTCAMFFKKNSNITKKKLGVYVSAQYLGAIIGSILALAIYDCQLVPYQNPVSLFRILRDSIGEFGGGFLFIYLILTVTGDETTFIYQTAWVHIFIPISLFAARSLSYFLGGVNPVIVTTLQVQAVITKGLQPSTIFQTILVELFCTVGAIVAVVFYQKIYKPAFIKYE